MFTQEDFINSCKNIKNELSLFFEDNNGNKTPETFIKVKENIEPKLLELKNNLLYNSSNDFNDNRVLCYFVMLLENLKAYFDDSQNKKDYVMKNVDKKYKKEIQICEDFENIHIEMIYQITKQVSDIKLNEETKTSAPSKKRRSIFNW